jgi:DNA-directed RNA polymerase subunit RPC12/RpoP
MKDNTYKCAICSKYFDGSKTYEYRGSYACEEHFDRLIKIIDNARANGIYDGDGFHGYAEKFQGYK